MVVLLHVVPLNLLFYSVAYVRYTHRCYVSFSRGTKQSEIHDKQKFCILFKSDLGQQESKTPPQVFHTPLQTITTTPLGFCNMHWASEKTYCACYNTDMLSEAVGAVGVTLVFCRRRESREEGDSHVSHILFQALIQFSLPYPAFILHIQYVPYSFSLN